jgi:hypothetical protein
MAQSVHQLHFALFERKIAFQFPEGKRYYSLLQGIYTGSGAHTASYSTIYGGILD